MTSNVNEKELSKQTTPNEGFHPSNGSTFAPTHLLTRYLSAYLDSQDCYLL